MNATIYGRIGRDAELKDSNSGTKLARFSVALNTYDYKTKESGTTWAEVTVFGKLAESKAAYLTKGSSVALSGELSLYTYNNDRDGGPKTVLQMKADTIALLGAGATKARAASAGDDEDSSIPF